MEMAAGQVIKVMKFYKTITSILVVLSSCWFLFFLCPSCVPVCLLHYVHLQKSVSFSTECGKITEMLIS